MPTTHLARPTPGLRLTGHLPAYLPCPLSWDCTPVTAGSPPISVASVACPGLSGSLGFTEHLDFFVVPGLTSLPEQEQPSLGLLQGQHEGRLGCVEAEAALVVALAGEVVVDARGDDGQMADLVFLPALLRSLSDRLLPLLRAWPPEGCPQPVQQRGQAPPERVEQRLPEGGEPGQSGRQHHPHGGHDSLKPPAQLYEGGGGPAPEPPVTGSRTHPL